MEPEYDPTLLKRVKTKKLSLPELKNLDLNKCNSFSDLTRGMSLTAFGGRQLGEAVDVAETMIRDKDCLKILTLSGAMTIAKMNLVICDMIDHGMIDAIVSTGALIAHGFVGSCGLTHFKNPGNISDEELMRMGYDRVYDSLETEDNFFSTSDIYYETFDNMANESHICSYKILEEFGKYLKNNSKERNVFTSTYDKRIPIFVPAFTDSEIGIEFFLNNIRRVDRGEKALKFEPLFDLEKYAEMVTKAKKIGIFTIGGGVPRNWAQQIGPLLQWHAVRSEKDIHPSEKEKYAKRFTYGVRICPEPAHWGGLSGCTYSEGVSWGKFVPKDKGGRYAEVICDATIAWPIIVKALLERLKK